MDGAVFRTISVKMQSVPLQLDAGTGCSVIRPKVQMPAPWCGSQEKDASDGVTRADATERSVKTKTGKRALDGVSGSMVSSESSLPGMAGEGARVNGKLGAVHRMSQLETGL